MLCFENVSYTYPFQQRPAVSTISLQVKPGDKVTTHLADGYFDSEVVPLL